ncbi:MAG: MmcB family DNA repair protein [Rhizobiaceae bacterium]|nr:MmcB family DNA repair protein [Rhizobiaceae bacterium]
MPIVSLNAANPFIDGRQSQRALMIRTGVERYFTDAGWATLPELTLPTGRRADLVALSGKGQVCIVEVKSSVADLKADNKWPEYHDYCDELIFATLADVPAEIFPEAAGFMVADAHGAELLRPPPLEKMAAARRKVVHLAFARASAQRLARCCAHAGLDSTFFNDS